MHVPPVWWFAFTTAAALNLRLVEQACGCATVRGGGRLKVRARLCRWHSGVESAWRQDPRTLPLQRKPP